MKMLKQLYTNRRAFLDQHYKQIPFIVKRHFSNWIRVWNVETGDLVSEGLIIISKFYDDHEEEMFADEKHVASFIWQYVRWQMWIPLRKNYEHIHIPLYLHSILSRYEKNLPLRQWEKKYIKDVGFAAAAFMARNITRNPRAPLETLISFDGIDVGEATTEEIFQRIHEILTKNNAEWLGKEPMRWEIVYRHAARGESIAVIAKSYGLTRAWIAVIYGEVLKRMGREPEILKILSDAVDDSETRRRDKIKRILKAQTRLGMAEYYGDSGVQDFVDYLERNME